jgi:hypothetical protein
MSKRTSKFHGLDYIVECMMPATPFWETIAAFNGVMAAVAYATYCEKSNGIRGYKYRVQHRKPDNQWEIITH